MSLRTAKPPGRPETRATTSVARGWKWIVQAAPAPVLFLMATVAVAGSSALAAVSSTNARLFRSRIGSQNVVRRRRQNGPAPRGPAARLLREGDSSSRRTPPRPQPRRRGRSATSAVERKGSASFESSSTMSRSTVKHLPVAAGVDGVAVRPCRPEVHGRSRPLVPRQADAVERRTEGERGEILVRVDEVARRAGRVSSSDETVGRGRRRRGRRRAARSTRRLPAGRARGSPVPG